MSITKEVMIDKVEIVGPYKMVQLRQATIILEDGVELTRSFNRRVVTPLCDTSNEEDYIKGVCAAAHTSDIKTAYTALLESQSA